MVNQYSLAAHCDLEWPACSTVKSKNLAFACQQSFRMGHIVLNELETTPIIVERNRGKLLFIVMIH